MNALLMPKKPALYRIEVIPLTPLFGKKDPRFSYAAKEPVSFGSLLSIPFGPRQLTGVAVASAPLISPVPHWMKYVGPTLLPGFLTEEQFALATEISSTYFTPLGIVLKHFFPVSKLPRVSKGVIEKSLGTKVHKHAAPKSTAKLLTELRTILVAKVSCYRAVSSEEALHQEVIASALLTFKAKCQILILAPEILAAELWQAKLRAVFPTEQIALFTSGQTAKEQYEIFESIRSGETKIIIGTRQALFAPYHNLAAILMLDPESRLSYDQWEMAPRYQGAAVAEMLAQIQNAPLVRLSPSPGLSYFSLQAKRSKMEKTRQGKPFSFAPPESLVPIDMRKNFKKRSAQEMLSFELVGALGTALKQHESALLLVRQRGLSRVSLCIKCQTVLRCPKCQNALSEATSGSYRCLSCSYRSTLFPSCSACGHMHFKSFGAGTGAVLRSLETRFPYARTILIDRDTTATKAGVKKLVATLTLPGPHVLVSTYETARALPLPPLPLIAMIEPDEGLFFPDYQADERLWIEIRRFGAKLTPRGKLLVQTFQPEKASWSLWPRETLASTAEALLDERQTLRYPPFFDLLLIECPKSKQETSLELSQRLYTEIKTILPPDILIDPPFLPFSKKHTDYRIILRIPTATLLPRALIVLLAAKSQEMRITLNPASLHS